MAYRNLSIRLEEIDTLRRPLVGQIDPKTIEEARENSKVEKAINRASHVMLCGHLQGYIEDVIIEFLDLLIRSNALGTKVPTNLKMELSKRALEPFRDESRNDELRTYIPEFIKDHQNLWCANTSLSECDYPDISHMDWEFGNPSFHEVEGRLKKLGIKSPFKRIDMSGEKRWVKLGINNMVEIRNAIAHGDLNTPVENKTIEDNRITILKFTEIIDECMVNHYFDITGMEWPIQSI